MRPAPTRWLLLLLAAAALAATPTRDAFANPCADGGSERPDEGGIGGTGRGTDGVDEGGIGGTGAHPDEGGIGGTGRERVGVIGTVTGFGSICIGRVEVHYAPETRVTVDDRPADAHALDVGQVVEVVADQAAGELRARAISVRHVVVGPITRVDAAGGRIDVLHQATEPPTGDTRTWAVGDVVAVSGMRRGDGTIVATDVRAVDAPLAVLTGTWRYDAEGPGATVAGVRVRGAHDTVVRDGAVTRVVGQWTDGVLQLTSAEVLPAAPFGGAVGRAIVEGFARMTPDRGLRIGDFTVGASEADLSILRDGVERRVRFDARVLDTGRFTVMRIQPLDVLPLHFRNERGGERRSGGSPPHEGGSPHHDARPAGPDDAFEAAPPDTHARPDMPPRPGGGGPDRPARPARPDRPEPPARPDVPRPERPNRAEQPGRPERPPTGMHP